MNKSKKFFIVVEGIDHSWKTTISKLLSNKLWWKYIYTSGPFDTIRPLIKDSSNTIKLLFYMMTNHYFSEQFSNFEEDIIICDRYRYSSIGYHTSISLNKQFITSLVKPDIVIYTYADRSIIEQRKKESKKISLWNEDLKFLRRIDKIIRDILPKQTLFINTGEINIEDCLNIITKKINLLKKKKNIN